MTFLGCTLEVNGYRIWLIDDNKCVISRDVVFNELCFYKTNVYKQGAREK